LPEFKMYSSGYESSPYRIEWMRFEPDCPLPEIVQIIPYIAFEVDDLTEALKNKKVNIEPNSTSDGIQVAFIVDNSAPVELMQYIKK
jgi:hypothetical protein